MKILDEAKLKRNIDENVKRDIEEEFVGGGEIIVNQNGERVFHELYGKKNASEDISPDCLYRIASMTKPVTACAVLKEVERGNIDLDDDVSNYLPEFEYSKLDIAKVENFKQVIVGKNTKPIKVFHLLTHTSGIGSDWLFGKALAKMTDDDRKSLGSTVAYYSKEPLQFEPFTKECYSPTASFDVAAKIVEKTSGKPFDVYLKDNFFDPLGMKDTTFTPTKEQWGRVVGMFDRDQNGKGYFCEMPEGCVYENFPAQCLCAGAGLVSGAEDYSRFAEMLLAEGKDKKGNTILDGELIKSKMATPLVPASLMGQNIHQWGLGVRVITNESYILPVGSFGWSGAWATAFWVDPVNRITAIYMKNIRCTRYGEYEEITKINFEKDVMDALK
ncbi:MAG: beta-lactamase family protein [Clostridia bacterium]|nr:beta-lactamase family protein [Clostridia bacterium]